MQATRIPLWMPSRHTSESLVSFVFCRALISAVRKDVPQIWKMLSNTDCDLEGSARIFFAVYKEMSMDRNQRFTLCFVCILIISSIKINKMGWLLRNFVLNTLIMRLTCFSCFPKEKCDRNKLVDSKICLITSKISFSLFPTMASHFAWSEASVGPTMSLL